MVKEPFNSILNRDLSGLCRFVDDVPADQWGLSQSSRSPTQFAAGAGFAIATAVFIAAAPGSMNEIEWSFETLIENVIAEFSESSLCSGWNDNIEYELWSIINHQHTFLEHDRLDWLPDKVKESIKNVANLGNCWVMWSDATPDPKPINLSRWQEHYELWRSERS